MPTTTPARRSASQVLAASSRHEGLAQSAGELERGGLGLVGHRSSKGPGGGNLSATVSFRDVSRRRPARAARRGWPRFARGGGGHRGDRAGCRVERSGIIRGYSDPARQLAAKGSTMNSNQFVQELVFGLREAQRFTQDSPVLAGRLAGLRQPRRRSRSTCCSARTSAPPPASWPATCAQRLRARPGDQQEAAGAGPGAGRLQPVQRGGPALSRRAGAAGAAAHLLVAALAGRHRGLALGACVARGGGEPGRRAGGLPRRPRGARPPLEPVHQRHVGRRDVAVQPDRQPLLAARPWRAPASRSTGCLPSRKWSARWPS